MRRRRARYTWFPTNPTFFGENPDAYSWYANSDVIGPNVPGFGLIQAIPLLQDADIQPGEASQDAISLRDRVEGKDYAVERIVGKVWCSVQQLQAEAGEYIASEVLVAMGLAVLPVDDNADQPSMPVADYDPLLANNMAQPWIWRRTWNLYNAIASPQGFITGPSSIGGYGSVMDGGHVDAKSSRRVRREQRLFWIMSAYASKNFVNGTSSVPIEVELSFGYDLRILGAMRRARNESTFK